MSHPHIRITWQLSNKYRIDETNEESVPLTKVEVPSIDRKRSKWAVHSNDTYGTLVTEHLYTLFGRGVQLLDSEDTNVLERAYTTCTTRHSLRIHYTNTSSLSSFSTTVPSSLMSLSTPLPTDPHTNDQETNGTIHASAFDKELADYYEESGRPVPPRLLSLSSSSLLPSSSSSPSFVSSRSSATFTLPFPSNYTVIRCGLRKFSPLIHWESPLAAANRAEGLIMVYPSGGYSSSVPYIFRCSPVDVQEFIGTLLVNLRSETATDYHDPSSKFPSFPMNQIIRIPHRINTVSSSSPLDDPSTKYFMQAEMEKQAYFQATQGILVLRTRVENGGELWTKEEKQARLDRLKTMVDQISRELSQQVHQSQQHNHHRSNEQHHHHNTHASDEQPSKNTSSSIHVHSSSTVPSSSKINDLSHALSNIATLTTDIAQNTANNTDDPSNTLLSSTLLQLSYNELAQIAMDNLTDVQKSILEAYDKGYSELNRKEE